MPNWLGEVPSNCQICQRRLEKVFYDAKIEGLSDAKGSWAIVCESCFPRYAYGLGTGRGQMYEVATGRKVAG